MSEEGNKPGFHLVHVPEAERDDHLQSYLGWLAEVKSVKNDEARQAREINMAPGLLLAEAEVLLGQVSALRTRVDGLDLRVGALQAAPKRGFTDRCEKVTGEILGYLEEVSRTESQLISLRARLEGEKSKGTPPSRDADILHQLDSLVPELGSMVGQLRNDLVQLSQKLVTLITRMQKRGQSRQRSGSRHERNSADPPKETQDPVLEEQLIRCSQEIGEAAQLNDQHNHQIEEVRSGVDAIDLNNQDAIAELRAQLLILDRLNEQINEGVQRLRALRNKLLATFPLDVKAIAMREALQEAIAVIGENQREVSVLRQSVDDKLARIEEIGPDDSERFEDVDELNSWVDEQLRLVGGIAYNITSETDGVRDAYAPIIARVHGFKDRVRADQSVLDIERRVYIQYYGSYIIALLHHVNSATTTPAGSAELKEDRKNVYSGTIYVAMEGIERRLKPKDAEDLQAFRERLSGLVDAWCMQIYSYNTVHARLLGNGETREPPGGLISGFGPDANYPFDSKGVLNQLICETLEETMFNDEYNPVIQPSKPHRVDNYLGSDGVLELTYDETATSWAMNYMRRVFAGVVPDAKHVTGVPITSSNLHQTEGSLIEVTYQALVNHMRALGFNEPETQVSRVLVQRAYQTLLMLTGDHCALAKGSVEGYSDRIYYMNSLLRYLVKYACEGKTDAALEPLLMIMTFDLDDGYFSPVVFELDAQKRRLSVENRIRDLNRKAQRKAKKSGDKSLVERELFELLGSTTTECLLEPLLVQDNRSKGFEPLVKDGKIVHDQSGSPVFVRRENSHYFASFFEATPLQVSRSALQRGQLELANSPDDATTLCYGQGNSADGLGPTVCLTDLEDLQTGDFPFSMVNWDMYAEKNAAFWNNLAKNGSWLLSLLMCSEEEFIKKLGDFSALSTTDNKVGYAVPLLAKAAPEIATDRAIATHPNGWECSWKRYMMYGITIRLIMARVMMMAADTKTIDVDKEINRFLNRIGSENVIPASEETRLLITDTIRTIVTTNRGAMWAKLRFTQKLKDKIVKATDVS